MGYTSEEYQPDLFRPCAEPLVWICANRLGYIWKKKAIQMYGWKENAVGILAVCDWLSLSYNSALKQSCWFFNLSRNTRNTSQNRHLSNLAYLNFVPGFRLMYQTIYCLLKFSKSKCCHSRSVMVNTCSTLKWKVQRHTIWPCVLFVLLLIISFMYRVFS